MSGMSVTPPSIGATGGRGCMSFFIGMGWGASPLAEKEDDWYLSDGVVMG